MANACITELINTTEDSKRKPRRCSSGKVAVLDPEKFYRCYGPKLRSVALRILKDPALAEDALQDTFINIFRFINDFRGECRIETWMTRITVNVCLGYIRKNKVLLSALNEGELEGQLKENFFRDKGHSPIEVVYKNEIAHYVHKALGNLKKSHREVIFLHDFSHKTIEEIANQKGIPEGTVKSRLFYARKELKGYLTSLFTRQACQPI